MYSKFDVLRPIKLYFIAKTTKIVSDLLRFQTGLLEKWANLPFSLNVQKLKMCFSLRWFCPPLYILWTCRGRRPSWGSKGRKWGRRPILWQRSSGQVAPCPLVLFIRRQRAKCV